MTTIPLAKIRTVLTCSLGGKLTNIIQYGHLGQDNDGKRYIFLIIPGNPGVMEYYEAFMLKLYNLSGGTIPVWGISHTGHVHIKEDCHQNHTDFKESPCSLKSQIENKVEFIKSQIPSDVKILLIGHSIGCYIILHMLEKLDEHQVARCFMLFPTIEQMARTPNGVVVTPTLRYFRGLAVWIVKLFNLFPKSWRNRLIQWHLRHNDNVPDCIFSATHTLVKPHCVHNSLNMAYQEMQEVMRCDEHLVNKYEPILSFYHGQHDKWCPRVYYYAMKERFPNCDIRLCNRGCEHAFVIKDSETMADIVWDWFKDAQKKEKMDS